MAGLPLDLDSMNPLAIHDLLSGFYRKSLKERRTLISSLLSGLWGQDENSYLKGVKSASGVSLPTTKLKPLAEVSGNRMVENYIGNLSIPVGLGLNFTINNKPVIIPMCMEESSVIAAASGGAKTISQNGGFLCYSSTKNIITSQIQLRIKEENIDDLVSLLEAKKSDIIKEANKFCEKMVNRGGGVLEAKFTKVIAKEDYRKNLGPLSEKFCSKWIIVNLTVDVCESMGANCASHIAEGISPYLSKITKTEYGVRIVSNFAPYRLAHASFCIPVKNLSYKGVPGVELAQLIVESNIWAACDISRATTHNKGIMNGVDAVALAMGQDWRAVEASVHAMATIKDPASSYAPLTDYWIDNSPISCIYKNKQDTTSEELYLHGSLSLPLLTGTKGGALAMNESYSSCMRIMGPGISSQHLAQAMTAVGLAQNFAALRALCSDGIQSGHMSLHAWNIALQAGVSEDKLEECVEYMKKCGNISVSCARAYISSL